VNSFSLLKSRNRILLYRSVLMLCRKATEFQIPEEEGRHLRMKREYPAIKVMMVSRFDRTRYGSGLSKKKVPFLIAVRPRKLLGKRWGVLKNPDRTHQVIVTGEDDLGVPAFIRTVAGAGGDFSCRW
jgi:hypothetical protein